MTAGEKRGKWRARKKRQAEATAARKAHGDGIRQWLADVADARRNPPRPRDRETVPTPVAVAAHDYLRPGREKRRTAARTSPTPLSEPNPAGNRASRRARGERGGYLRRPLALPPVKHTEANRAREKQLRDQRRDGGGA